METRAIIIMDRGKHRIKKRGENLRQATKEKAHKRETELVELKLFLRERTTKALKLLREKTHKLPAIQPWPRLLTLIQVTALLFSGVLNFVYRFWVKNAKQTRGGCVIGA